MGDRCYLEITYKREDAELVCMHLELDIPDGDNPIITEQIEEANHAIFTEREALAADGIMFHGFHCSGGEYPAAEFAACDGELLDADTTTSTGLVIGVNIKEDGKLEPNPQELAHVQRYVDKDRHVRAEFERIEKAWKDGGGQ